MDTKNQEKAPKIRAGITVVDASGQKMAVTTANQEREEAHCVWEDQYGRTVAETKRFSELTPV